MDLIRYDATEGRLRIAARSGKLVSAYRRIFGHVLFGDPQFFLGCVRCTLQPLQEKGAELLQNLPPNMTTARVVDLVWHRGGTSIRVRDDDCLAQVKALELPLHEGELVEARFEFRFVRGRRIDKRFVVVRTPNRISNRSDRYEKAIDQFLFRIGIRLRNAPKHPVDLWSLHPWKHSETRWREALGLQLRYFVEEGLLVSSAVDSVPHPDHPTPRTALRVRHEGEHIEGVSDDPHIPSRALTLSDVDGYELRVDALAERLARALNIASVVKPVGGYCWPLRSRRAAVRAGEGEGLRSFRKPPAAPGAMADRLRQIAGSKVQVGLVVPSGCAADIGLAEVQFDTGDAPFDGVLNRLISRLGLEKEALAVEQAPAGTRVVIDRKRGTIHLDGVLLSSIDQQSHYFRSSSSSPPRAETSCRRRGSTRSSEAETLARRCERRKEADGRSDRARLQEGRRALPGLNEIIVTHRGGYSMPAPAFVS